MTQKANGTIRAFCPGVGRACAKVSAEVEADVASACQKMGKDLGIHDADQMAEAKGAGGKAEWGVRARGGADRCHHERRGQGSNPGMLTLPTVECRVEGDAYSS